MINEDTIVPKMIFIIPYRNRQEEQINFIFQMNKLLDCVNKTEYSFYFIHQCDDRDFCRGALKNIGFLMVKNKYPYCYKNITLIFNDIDTFPKDKNIIYDYSTVPGIIKHFYGYSFALGGIVSTTCGDFESINGFPNYWSWGFEDNLLNQRALKANLIIDRSVFYKANDSRITQINSSNTRIVNKAEFERYIKRNTEGIQSIQNLQYTIDGIFVNVSNFNTEYTCNQQLNTTYDVRNIDPPFSVGYSSSRRSSMNLIHS